jgi:hypothetical protein
MQIGLYAAGLLKNIPSLFSVHKKRLPKKNPKKSICSSENSMKGK